MKSISRIRNSYIRISPLFRKEEKQKLLFAVLVNTVLSILDIVGVALIGLIAALSVRGIQSSAPGSRVSEILAILNLNQATLQTTVSILGLSAALAFLLRTTLSAIVTKWLLNFLGKKSANVSHDVSKLVLGRDIQAVEATSENETLYTITSGAVSLILGVVGSAITLVSDLILVSVLLALLIFFNPAVALPTTLMFVLTGLLLNKAMHAKASKLGLERFHLVTSSNTEIIDALSLQRNIYTSNLQDEYLNRIHNSRVRVGKNLAESEFMPYVTKYVIEIVLVVFSFSLAATQFVFQDASHAIATLSIFMAAGMRIAPAVMRMQQASIHMVGSLGNSEPTLLALKNLNDYNNENRITQESSETNVLLECSNLGFNFNNSNDFALADINLRFNPNTLVAIVGPSGSGKSTLVDLLLGILKPKVGKVEILGSLPELAIQDNPSLIGFVPQRTHLIAGSVIENVYLTNKVDLNLEKFWSVMRQVGLFEFVQDLPQSHLTLLGDGGMKLSGGQAQRLGIARALIKNPQIIILDEATSALDAQAEDLISKSVSNLRTEGACVIVIAHRLSTVREADTVIYLDRGEVIAQGKFDELRRIVPDFDNQARIMGL